MLVFAVQHSESDICIHIPLPPWASRSPPHPTSLGHHRALSWVPGAIRRLLTSYFIQGRRRQWHPTPVLLPGKSHGRRSLVGCRPWGLEESDTNERLHFHFSLSCIGEGNGNPLQCSCLENPRDRGAWWAAVYGVAQSRTRLKRLSSSSSRVNAYLQLSYLLFGLIIM